MDKTCGQILPAYGHYGNSTNDLGCAGAYGVFLWLLTAKKSAGRFLASEYKNPNAKDTLDESSVDVKMCC